MRARSVQLPTGVDPARRTAGDTVVARAASNVALPPGTPTWITPDLLNLTLKVWQPFYTHDLSADDAVTILQSVGQLFRALRPVSSPSPEG